MRLRLDSVDWDAERIHVDSPKTEHHPGGASRVVPIFPELRPYLEEVWNEAEAGETHFITRYRNPSVNLFRQFLAIVKRANLTPWPKVWHNMRASRQTELEDIFPSHVVCSWLGNSIQVAHKHYLQTTDAHFAKATAGECGIFVASSTSQEAANDKSNAHETAQTCYDSQYFAPPSVDRGQLKGSIASGKRESTPECAKIVATPCIEVPEIDPLKAWLADCPIPLDDAQQDAIRDIVGE